MNDTTRTTRALIAAAALTLLVGACTTNEADPTSTLEPLRTTTTTTLPPTTVAPTTTVTTVPPPTTTGTTVAAEIPYPQTDTDDPIAAYEEINRFFNWLEQNPDPDLLTEVISPECRCYQPNLNSLQQLVTEGLHYGDDGTELLSVTLISNDGTEAELEIIDQSQPSRPLVDASGEVVDGVVGWDPQVVQIILERGEDDRWKVTTGEILREATPDDLAGT